MPWKQYLKKIPDLLSLNHLLSIRLKKYILILLFSSSMFPTMVAQVTDSAIVDTATDVGRFKDVGSADIEPALDEHSPRKAALYSAVLPGLGQAYNQKYWKIPVLYAGIGVLIYYIQRNNYFYNQFRNAWYEYELTQESLPEGKYDLPGYNPLGDNSTQLKRGTETFERWRDGTIIGLVAVYFLNIIDATVDAHFYNFDVTQDLSLKVSPIADPFYTMSFGAKFSLNF